MHEFGIMETLLRDAVRAAGGAPLRRMKVRVGPLSGVLADTLRFAFEALSPGTPAAGARLELAETTPRFRCRDCGLHYDTPVGSYRCPGCGSVSGDLLSGNEMELESIEV